jgi:hypothetical protein
LLGLVKTSKASSPFTTTIFAQQLCLQVIWTCSLIFLRLLCNLMLLQLWKHFHVNTLTWIWLTLEAFCILQHFFP